MSSGRGSVKPVMGLLGGLREDDLGKCGFVFLHQHHVGNPQATNGMSIAAPAEDQLNKSDEILDAIVTSPYKYGFTTDVGTEEFEKGLNEDIIDKISLKSNVVRYKLAN